MTGPQGMGPLRPMVNAIALSEFSDDFNRANGNLLDGTIPQWWEVPQLSTAPHPWYVLNTESRFQIDTNEVEINNTNARAIWFNPCQTLNQYSMVDIMLVPGTRMGAAVRMNQPQKDGADPAPLGRYSGGFYKSYGSGTFDYWFITKTNASGVTTDLALSEQVIPALSDTITVKLVALDVGTLGTMLLLYRMVAGVPEFIIGTTDPAAADLQGPCVGFEGGIDLNAISAGQHVIDNWLGGDFVEDAQHPIPALTGGRIRYLNDDVEWLHEFIVDTGMNMATAEMGPRNGISVPDVNVLVVAGGGGGGNVIGGGGGAGGVRYDTVTVSSIEPITVGTGGQPSQGNPGIVGTNGGNSSFGSISCTGGGLGAGSSNTGLGGRSGGSGGGGSFNNATTIVGGTGISGEGNNGGNSVVGGVSGGGGGGGAGAVGGNGAAGTGGVGGIGGDGKVWPTANGGDGATYGGGGGGGRYANAVGGAGGTGGGGRGGGRGPANFALPGTKRTGGGGGGGGNNDGPGGSTVGGLGGSGIVKARYNNP